MKVSENFTLQEFIDRETYQRFGANSIWFIDQRIITIAQLVRDRFGVPVTINNWITGGKYNLSGFRPPSTKIGASLSQHKFGRAVDLKLKGVDPVELSQDIQENFEIYKKVGLTTIENVEKTPSWLHADARWHNEETLKIVNP